MRVGMTMVEAQAQAAPARRHTEHVHGDTRRMVQVITWVAAVIAMVVAIAVPVAYAGLAWSSARADAGLSAKLYAVFVTQAAALSAGDWREDVKGLVDAPLYDGGDAFPEHREVRDDSGRLITQSADPVEWPVVEARAAVAGRDGVIGEVVLRRSVRSLVLRTSLVTMAAVALGLAIYLSLRIWPMRVLARTIAALDEEQRRSRRILERQLDVLFQQAADGMVVFDEHGIVQSCNAQAVRMFGASAASISGQPVSRWLAMPRDHSDSLVPPLGKWESELIGGAQSGDGGPMPVEFSVHGLSEADQSLFFCLIRDISERRSAERRMTRLAKFDSLTGLPNRSTFRDVLEQAMSRAERSGRQVALMFLDLDRFKTVNDSLGHHVGDLLLQHVATTLCHCLRGGDAIDIPETLAAGATVSRLGGDEFTVIVEQLDGATQAAAVARRILAALCAPFMASGQEIVISTSVGITLYPEDRVSADELIRHADMAMYHAKEQGRNGYHFYSSALNSEAAHRLDMELGLRHALERAEFELEYQPRVALADGTVTSVEALLRWRRTPETLFRPDEFIGILEDTGLIVEVGDWVLRSALAQLRAWHDEGLTELSMAVNLSARQLRDVQFLPSVVNALSSENVSAKFLELELTESMLMDGDAQRHTLDQIAALGVRLAIDDFGMGYSSLSYLKRLRVNTLKIDRSFVKGLPNDSNDAAISTALIALGKSLNMTVIAEGVETPEQYDFLKGIGCDEIQGYLLSRPVPPQAFSDWLRNRLERGRVAPGAMAPT